MTQSSKLSYSHSLITILVALLVCIHESQAAPRRKRAILAQQGAQIQFCVDSPCGSRVVNYNIKMSDSGCINLGIHNDQISHVKIQSGYGRCQVTLYSDAQCRGARLRVSNSENDLLRTSFNDIASSFTTSC